MPNGETLLAPKLILNPSRLQDLEKCKLLFHRKHNLLLDFPGPPASAKSGQPLLGTLTHVAQAAYDTSFDFKKAIANHLRDLRKTIYYNVKYAPLVDQIERDAIKIFRGGEVTDGRNKVTTWPSYPTWRGTMFGVEPDDAGWRIPVEVEIVDVEKRLWADVGPVILAPKLDAVIRVYNVFGDNEETWWVEEHKTTARDDSNWRWRWEMDGQTTAQILAAEEAYGVDFEGVLINQVVVTRRKGDQGLMPLNKVVRYPARWVSKKEEVRTLFRVHLEDLAHDFEARSRRGQWTATGMLNRHCDLCNHRDVCSGRKPSSSLQPIPKDPIRVEFERRASKLALPDPRRKR